jgi:hypothetical protein
VKFAKLRALLFDGFHQAMSRAVDTLAIFQQEKG